MNTPSPRMIIFVTLIALVIGGIIYLNSQKASRAAIGGKVEVKTTMNKEEKTKRYPVAKEITTPDGFINTEGKPVAIGEFVGKKVVLLDIWTYSCINCQRTTPYLNAWYEKYKDKGLVIIGLHTPEFEFEKDYQNVLKATKRIGIKFPVVLDNDYSTWNAYQNRFWPRKYLIDIDGFVVYDHIGEGAYEETEKKIVELLNERSTILGEEKVPFDMKKSGNAVDVQFGMVKSKETYLGSSRVEYIANLPGPSCFGNICNFTEPGSLPLNTFALSGAWTIKKEEAYLNETPGDISIRFSANKVNLVAGGNGKIIRAEIYLDDKKISDIQAGSDVKDGNVLFENSQLYNLVDLRGNYGEHILKIKILDGGFSGFAFTFG
ncbi:MAG: redoxin family protein [Patescibacteria group bacterium]